MKVCSYTYRFSFTVADPDLELRGGGGGGVCVLVYLPCWPLSLQSFLLFLPKIRGGRRPRAPPLDLPLFHVYQTHFHISERYCTRFRFQTEAQGILGNGRFICLRVTGHLIKHLSRASFNIEGMISSLTAQLQLDTRKTIGNSAFKLKPRVSG